MKRFSRAGSVSEFFSQLDTGVFQRQVLPFIEKCMMDVASVLMLSPVRLFKKEAKYSNLYDEDVIHVSPVFARPEFYFERTELQTRYKLKVFLEEKELLLSKRNNRIITNEPCLMLYRNQLIAFEKLNAKRLMPFFEKDVVSVPNTIEEKYYSGFILNTVRDFDVKASGFEIREADISKKAVLSLEVDLQYRPAFVLRFNYGQENFLPGSARQVSVSLQKSGSSYVFLKTVRDCAWEEEVITLLKKNGLAEINGYYHLKNSEVLEQQNALYHLLNWLGENRDWLKKQGVEVVQKQGDKKYFTGSGQLEIKTQTRGDWFDVYAVVHFGEYSIPFIRLKKYILNGIHEFVLPNGETAILPDEWFARYKGLLPYGKDKGERIEFHKHHFTLLQQSFEGIDSDVKEKFLKLKEAEKEETVLPLKLKANLRTYQEEGFNWMYSLYKNGLGGCLADDMGLGKTLQTLTLLLKLKRSQQPVKTGESDKNGQLDMFGGSKPGESVQPATLIVLPTSLVHNWSNEISKFTPSLKVYKYVGLQRKKVEDIGQISRFYDIILTTYGTMRNDSEMLATTEFFYLILDESQSIKNSASKTYTALLKIKARHKLVITGTPIENSLSDLWSQMNFLNPGLLGSLAFFKRMFITPIEKHANEEQMEKLQLMIRPFVLRRKKMEVARDLPPLMEEVRICSMADDQQKLYDKEKSIIRNTILSTIEKEAVCL
ncbi:MAG: SNF2-related protein [Draconibacterium sp.]